MITKWYEISCDECGCACIYQGSFKSAEEQFEDDGGIVIKRKHYCDKCKKEVEEDVSMLLKKESSIATQSTHFNDLTK